MKWLIKLAVVFVSVSIVGCSSSYTIQVIDGLPREVYIKFDKGVDVNIGDMFILYRMQPPSSGGSHSGHHGSAAPLNLKQEVGRVRVTRIMDDMRAEVKVISGNVEEGFTVEKLK